MKAKPLLENTDTQITKIGLNSSSFYLEGKIDLILHTRLAQSLLEGHWGYGQLGLWQFALKVRDLWKGHHADDPYADWYFMQIDEKIHTIREEIQALESYCAQRLSQLRGLEVTVFENPRPLQLALKLGSPFSYRGAALLPELDYVTRQAHTLRRVGQLLEPKYLPFKIVSSIRQLFSLPLSWKRLATRQDIRENNEAAKKAQEKMGVVPEQILNKDIPFLSLLNTLLGSTKPRLMSS